MIVALFGLSAAVIWFAGVTLAFTTDAIDAHVGWGEGMGGAVFLAVATNLPEVAIIAGCAYNHNMSLAVGNILGGIGRVGGRQRAVKSVIGVVRDRAPGIQFLREIACPIVVVNRRAARRALARGP